MLPIIEDLANLKGNLVNDFSPLDPEFLIHFLT
jgi:hypothetical protein